MQIGGVVVVIIAFDPDGDGLPAGLDIGPVFIRVVGLVVVFVDATITSNCI